MNKTFIHDCRQMLAYPLRAAFQTSCGMQLTVGHAGSQIYSCGFAQRKEGTCSVSTYAQQESVPPENCSCSLLQQMQPELKHLDVCCIRYGSYRIFPTPCALFLVPLLHVIATCLPGKFGHIWPCPKSYSISKIKAAVPPLHRKGQAAKWPSLLLIGVDSWCIY